jgi:hypothetical protein
LRRFEVSVFADHVARIEYWHRCLRREARERGSQLLRAVLRTDPALVATHALIGTEADDDGRLVDSRAVRERKNLVEHSPGVAGLPAVGPAVPYVLVK